MRICRRELVFLPLGLIFLVLSALSLAQNAPPVPSSASPDSGVSLASAARWAKAQKAAKAKRVTTAEDMEASAGPLSRLKMEGAENADEVVAAISKYKLTHTPAQTEQAVRQWYDRYDEMLAAAIRQNLDIRTLRAANVSNGYELCLQSQDYQQCRNRQMAEQRGAQNDQAEQTKNSNLVVRIQHSFGKVRNGLQINNLPYDWFKIRTTNNIDRF
jgi:hypothetical protein